MSWIFEDRYKFGCKAELKFETEDEAVGVIIDDKNDLQIYNQETNSEDQTVWIYSHEIPALKAFLNEHYN